MQTILYLQSQIRNICVMPQTPFIEVIKTVQTGNKQIALVVDNKMLLLGLITDGDIRRAILAGWPMDTPAEKIMQSAMITGSENMSKMEIFKIMRAKLVRHLPLLDSSGTVKDLVWISDLISDEHNLNVIAVIMAGGIGRRLRPLTDKIPKPMLPLGDQPLIERTMKRLSTYGIKKINLTTYYKSHSLKEYFGDGRGLGIEICYLEEDSPLGTAGGLSLLPEPSSPVLVINGDILTQVDFNAMVHFHRDQGADITMAVRQHHLNIPYGVVECKGPKVVLLKEKPTYAFMVNCGIYLLEPTVLSRIPKGKYLDMTDLVQQLLQEGLPVVSFPVVEYWKDIGCKEDYRQAIKDTRELLAH